MIFGDVAFVTLALSILLGMTLFMVTLEWSSPELLPCPGVPQLGGGRVSRDAVEQHGRSSCLLQRGSAAWLLELVGRGQDEEYSCFLSHDWGADEFGRSTPQCRVRCISEAPAAGLTTWFDADRIQGDMNAAMCDGIDKSRTVVVFITRNYLTKAAGLGPQRLER